MNTRDSPQKGGEPKNYRLHRQAERGQDPGGNICMENAVLRREIDQDRLAVKDVIYGTHGTLHLPYCSIRLQRRPR